MPGRISIMRMKYGAVVVAPLLSWTMALGDNTAIFKRNEDGPKAISIPPSQYFEGNDGPWSTFDLLVGSSEQNVRVLVSTASPESFVVLSEYGCTSAAFETVPPDCAVSRGKLFNPNDSSTWQEIGDYGINQEGVGLEANLGYVQNAKFGLDRLGLGLTGPSLENQTIAGIATADPFYLGLFGLNTQPVNFTSIGNFSVPSFLTTLKDNGVIPSLSWSYTAGAIYRLKQVYGQLILSGYDTSRFVENTASFTMAGDLTRDLVVVLQSISYSGAKSASLLSEPIDIFIDSTVPYLWLPEDVCAAFEEAFGLTLDEETQLYLINETHHQTLSNSDAEVTFRLSDVKNGGDAVRIVLPYAAFDLTAESPLVENRSRYFPLKRAANSTQYTLGRTFLQEAYLLADYERGTFNVSACSWVEGAKENIVTILPEGAENSPGSGSGPGPDPGPGSGSKSKSLNGGAIAGIVVGAVIGAVLIIAAIVYLIRRQRKKAVFAAQEPEPDMAVITGPVYNHNSTRTGKFYSPDTVGTSTNAGSSVGNRSSPGQRSGDTNMESIPGVVDGQPELDGEETQVDPAVVRSGEEEPEVPLLDGEPIPPEREPTPVYHELMGTEIEKSEIQQDAMSTVGPLPARVEREEGEDHLDSPFVSTLGSNGWQDERRDSSSDLVSPTTPVHHHNSR